ncbi:MAG TPA: methyltransferase domain-containing protein [Candidatus Paceibacterota bacterium]|nr:methyltransferase domain-containing protein [Candidatus Paceibacterota bacterium]
MFSEPENNIAQLGLREGEIVADFGAGAGAYSIAAAKALRGTGRVYAIEVQKDLLSRLRNTAKEERLGNIEYLWGNLEKMGGTKLRDGSCDVVIVSNVLFQTPDKKAVINEAKRILHHGGRLLVVDWSGSFNSMGPTKSEVIDEHAARDLIDPMGFSFERAINAGNFHYGLVYRKGLYVPPNPEIAAQQSVHGTIAPLPRK